MNEAPTATNTMRRPIYLDYNSTTPMDPRVLEAMKPYFLEKFGNESSRSHLYGWEAHEAVDLARETIARAIGAVDKHSILFTSGATESNNLAIKGIVKASADKPAHVITQKTEHKCILESCEQLRREGHEVTFLEVDAEGFVDPKAVMQAARQNTLLCSIMFSNNEIGTIQPVAEIARLCYERGILFHTDAVQAVGKIPVNVAADGIDLLSLSGHKIYGPKGIGALYVAPRKPPIRLSPILQGGGHERDFRSGTLNVAGIVGLAKALALCMTGLEEEAKRLTALRDFLIDRIQERIPGALLNGPRKNRLPNNVNFSFEGIRSDDLLLKMPEIAVSTGSACSSGDPEPSYVIAAISKDKDEDRVRSSVRIGLGRWTSRNDVEKAAECLVRAVSELREIGVSLRGAKATKQAG